MKPLVLHAASIFLSLENKLKIFQSTIAYKKGRLALKWSPLEETTLMKLWMEKE